MDNYEIDSLKEAFRVIEIKDPHECIICGQSDDIYEIQWEIAKSMGYDYDELTERSESGDETVESILDEIFDKAVGTEYDAETGVCYNCGFELGIYKEAAQQYIDDYILLMVEKVVALIENLGGEAEVEHSGLSEAVYIWFLDQNAEGKKIRIATHDPMPWTQIQHEPANYRLNLYGADDKLAKESLKNILNWIKKVGVYTDD